MWRISAIARAPKNGSSSSSSCCSKAGTRRCFRDMRASSSLVSETSKPTVYTNSTRQQSAFRPNHHYQTNSRHFHTTPLVGSSSSQWTDGNDDADPESIPDFLDDLETYELSNNAKDREEEKEEEAREQYRIQQEKVNSELDNRKGRPWKDPWEIKEEQWMASDTSSESLQDWNPSFVSRISLERLQILSSEGGFLI